MFFNCLLAQPLKQQLGHINKISTPPDDLQVAVPNNLVLYENCQISIFDTDLHNLQTIRDFEFCHQQKTIFKS